MRHTIIDKSGDKKYFTQIPNMIVNHSTAYEQSLYLVMKRVAGEGGQCFASLNFIAKKMGVDKKTVSKTITRLLKREWIIETKKTKVPGGYTRTFIIIDLWKTNMDNYEGGDVDTTSKLGGGSIRDGGGRSIPRGGRHVDTNKIYNKIYNKKEISSKMYYKGDRVVESPIGSGKFGIWKNNEFFEYGGKKSDLEYK